MRIASLALSLLACPLAAQESEVPLARTGPALGASAGASLFDYDRDGYIDVFINSSGALWRNEGGVAWTRIADLDLYQPPIGARYGAACGDYDNDGYPDIATEPRQSNKDDCFHLLRNLGGDATFLDVATDPSIVIGQPCEMNAETACWGDVDEDGDLDLWVTAYPDVLGGSSEEGGGNRFWENLGPTGPGGAYRLELKTEEAGLGNPAGVSRPEGAQMLDYDRDGDIDAFTGNVIYQNRTETVPRFVQLRRRLSGITTPNILDEGALFADYDLDGDQDLFLVYQGQGNRLWESYGDGTFRVRFPIESPLNGATQGSSAEDWDLDGDLDLTTGHVLRRNMMVEGERRLVIASHDIPDEDIHFATPAWGDWDLDGDPDCVLANWKAPSFLYENTTYDADTPLLQKRTVRIRPLREAEGVPGGGLETEFGATVELRVHGDTSGFVRRRFVASSHGYLQQSEYALTMALPPGPDPEAPARGVVFDLLVDFPGLSSKGILRIGPEVNPSLGGIRLEELFDREIIVYRSGKVVLNGKERQPRRAGFSKRLATTAGGLLLPDMGAPLPEPTVSPAESWYVGVELDTQGSPGPLLVEELVLDGQLDVPDAACAGAFNVALWDVTRKRAARVWSDTFETSDRNRRTFFPVSFALYPNRQYRFVARVTELRGSPNGPPMPIEQAAVTGGMSYQDLDPCTGEGVKGASVDSSQVYLALRYRGRATAD